MINPLAVVESEGDVSSAISKIQEALKAKKEGEVIMVISISHEDLKLLEGMRKFRDEMISAVHRLMKVDKETKKSLEVVDGILGGFHDPNIKTIKTSEK